MQDARLREGLVSQLEVFDTERSLLGAQQEILSTYQQLLTDTVTLYKALGGGWDVGRRHQSPACCRIEVQDVGSRTAARTCTWTSDRETPMKVILKPISHPQMGDISIVDDLFAIGRNEEPFASELGDAAARLSRRHARIFQEDGKVFIADLGSLNGTRINEQPLKNGAAALQQ